MRRSRSAMVSLALTAMLAAVVAGVGCDESESNANGAGGSMGVQKQTNFTVADAAGYWVYKGGHDVTDGQTWILLPTGQMFLIAKHNSAIVTAMTWCNYIVASGTWRIEHGNELYIDLHHDAFGEDANISLSGNILEMDKNKMVLEDSTQKGSTDTLIRIGKGSAMEHAIISILDDHGCKIKD